jgi:hypothetical protein
MTLVLWVSRIMPPGGVSRKLQNQGYAAKDVVRA